MNDPRFIAQKNFDPKICFDPEMIEIARSCANDLPNHPEIKAMTNLKDIQKHIFEGSYFWITGPTYESKIECQFLTQLGMDAVGMSTVPEFMTASAIGMKTLGIAMISDVMDRAEPLSHLQVLANAEKAVPVLKILLLEIAKKLELKQSIRDEIDSHLKYKGDISKLEEYPLLEPREFVLPTQTQIKEAAAEVHKVVAKLDLKEVNMCNLFLNKLPYSEVIKCYDTCCKLHLEKLPNMPIFTASSKHGALAIGKLAGSGLNCISICNVDVEGFKNIESFFLAKVLKECGINHIYVTVEAEWLLTNSPAVLPISDYFCRSFVSDPDPSTQSRVGAEEMAKINCIIRSVHPSKDPSPILFGFEGPVKPTNCEKLTAATMKAKIFSVSSLYK